LTDPFELPSLEQIEKMEKQRTQAIESLEISNDPGSDSVKCQKFGIDIPLIGKLTKPKSNQIAVLEKRIKWLEEGYPHRHRRYGGANNNRASSDDNNNGNSSSIIVVQLKQELADLLEEDPKADRLRSLPLYSCRTTGWKFVCSKYYDRVYN
jgi:hypothetical protein